MREKLLVLMKNEGLTSSRLAELLGIQPSGISHILAGRNKPSFDFVQKILRRFPRINPDWLLLDSQDMYRTLGEEKSQTSENVILPDDQQNASQSAQNNQIASIPNSSSTLHTQSTINSVAQDVKSHGSVKRIIILYQDRTFESYEVER